ncbi:putative ubiquitin-like modifier-activating enzyme atg-7 [Rosellinia necatrix]|uniref:Ubiquitin-like modifier-activating enzyme ATG7 n=1 Tax=Rosellinia necatrix TaxID=77044 RepID=A0A1S7UJT1_ROSNE|nr:putative ubiquitin-like modifier-activating enzyme atg-7 [Rosellinia necatrix]
MATLKFAPFSSDIELPFYSALFASKLEHDKLSDSARPVLGVYEPRIGVHPDDSVKMQVLASALAGTTVPVNAVRAEGIIRNMNTMEAFRQANKVEILNKSARQIWDAINDGTIYSVPSLLSSYIILSYADLKKYRMTYWFGFPTLPSDPAWKRTGEIQRLTTAESTALVDRVGTWRYSVDDREYGFFLVKKTRGKRPSLDPSSEDIGYTWEIGSLRNFESGFFLGIPKGDRYVAFVDPSAYDEHPAWPLRNLLMLVRQRYQLNEVQILCYRDIQSRRHEARSIIIPLQMDSVDELVLSTMPKATGWERNQANKLTARSVSLAESMDPARLADQSVDLNLKLMKWRISPDLDLDIIKNTRCLLLGAGTLGSYVSRNLMGWGVRKITFIDYGSVSFSNPVRQPLFVYDDCLNGGAPKATRAAESLKQIYPGVDSHGEVLSVPMLGHPIGDKTQDDFEKLKALINEHDAIFLLMDSRESRWLPTVMGKAAGKIVMNAALGFDTYVVMRHGAEPNDGSNDTLGCYFCNDVVAPGDSQKDLTLDQQCTVTRPGIAAIASALLVELLTSLLQHPLGHHAPAPATASANPQQADTADEHALGIVPHQIRGFLNRFQNLVISGQSYPCCSACSSPILSAYRNEGWEFVKRALENKEYVAELSGLAEVQRKAEALINAVDWEEEGSAHGDDDEGVLL